MPQLPSDGTEGTEGHVQISGRTREGGHHSEDNNPAPHRSDKEQGRFRTKTRTRTWIKELLERSHSETRYSIALTSSQLTRPVVLPRFRFRSLPSDQSPSFSLPYSLLYPLPRTVHRPPRTPMQHTGMPPEPAKSRSNGFLSHGIREGLDGNKDGVRRKRKRKKKG